MIIDNEPNTDEVEEKWQGHNDTVTNQIVKVQYEVNEDVVKLAHNLETLKTLAENKGVFEDFTKVAGELLAKKFGDKTSLDILYENKDLVLSDATIKNMQDIGERLTELDNISKNLAVFKESNANVDTVKSFLTHTDAVNIIEASMDDIQRLARNIEKVRVLHTQIVEIVGVFDSIDEIHTIFNFLPYLLRLADFLKNYYTMSQIIIDRFEYYNEVVTKVTYEVMELNRNLSYEFNKVKAKFDALDGSDILKFAETINKLIVRIEALEQAEAKGYDDTELRNLINELTKKFSDLKTQVDTNTTNITNLTTRVDTAENNIIQIQGDVTNIQTDVTNLTNRVDKIDGDIVNINENITKLGDRVTVNEGNITTLTEKVTNIEGDITNLNTEITNVKNEQTTLNESITNINNEILQIKEKPVKITAGNNIEVQHDETSNTYTINATATGGGTTIENLKYSNFTLGETI